MSQKNYNMSQKIAESNLLPNPFWKGNRVYDPRLKRIGRVAKTSRKFVWVEYEDEVGLMVTTIVYRKWEVHHKLKHYREPQPAPSLTAI